MAISSTSTSTSATTTSSLDVASIVAQLMTAENKPIEVIKNKISTRQVFISDMGIIKSDVAALQDVLASFEDANLYNNLIASSTDASVVTASAGVGAVVGSHTVSVTQAAQTTAYNISGFSSDQDLISLDAINGFRVTIGNSIYCSDGSRTVGGVRTANAVSVISKSGSDSSNQATSTATDLKNWINGLGLDISANLVQQNSSHWSMQVASNKAGLGNDFSLTGLISGNAFSGFSANNSAVTLDPATGFQLTVGGHVYSTLGTYDGSANGSIATLASNTTIAALASWVNGLNVDVSAAVTGSAGSYSLQLSPKNSASFSTIGLCGAYATGFGSANDIVNLDQANGFQLSIGGKTYKTAGVGSVAITGTGAGGGITVTDLKDWINNLPGANLSASVVGSGSSYSLEVDNSNVLSAQSISIAGITSAGSAASTIISGFGAEAAPLSLIALNDLKLHVGATDYSGSAIVGTGIGGRVKLSDIVTWINGLGAGLTASVTGGGQAYSLNIVGTGNSAISLTGLKSNAIVTGFSSGANKINLDPTNGFQITSNGTTYSTTGSYTLSSLAAWINTQAGLSASVVGSGTTYDLVVTHSSDLSADQTDITMSGILSGTTTSNSNVVTANSTSDATTGVYSVAVTQLAATTEASITVAGFKNYNDQVDANYSLTIDGNIYRADTDYTINTHAVSRMSSTGVGVSGAYSTLTDLNNWINALSGAGLSISSSISGTPKNYNNDFSDIHVQGIDLPSDVSNNSGVPYYKIFAGSAPGAGDKHAIASSLFQFVSLDASGGPYADKSFNFSTDGSGNLMLNVYEPSGLFTSGQFLASEIQAIPHTFYRGDTVQIDFPKLGATLKLTATIDSASLGADRDAKIKEQAEAMATNTGAWATYIPWKTINGVMAMNSVGNTMALANLFYIDSGDKTDVNGVPYTLDSDHQVVLDGSGAILTDINGDPDYIKFYRFTTATNLDGSPSNSLTLEGLDATGNNVLKSQTLFIDPAIYDLQVTDYDLNFDQVNIRLHLNCSRLGNSFFPSAIVTNREIGQMALGIANSSLSFLANSNIDGTDNYIYRPTYQLGDINTTAITINQFSNLPPNKYMLTQADGGKLVLAAYNQGSGDYLGSLSATIDPSLMGAGDIQQLHFGDFGWGDIVLDFTLNTNATVQEISDLLTSDFENADTPNIANLRTYQLNPWTLVQYHLQANKDIGPTSIAPLPVADITELSYSSVPTSVDHYQITSEGSNVTMSAIDSGGNVVGAQTLSMPGTISANNKIVLDFDAINGGGSNQGGVKIVINPLISSSNGADNVGTNSYKNAASLIAQGLAYANKQAGVSGWLTQDVGSGLTLTILGSNGIQISDSGLSATDEILGSALSINETSVSASSTSAQYTITDTSGATVTYDAVADGLNQTIAGTTFTVNVGSLASAVVKISGNHDTNYVTPDSTSTTSGAAITTNSANTTSIYLLDGGMSKYTTAQDAHLTIDGVDIVRSTNTISDFVTGLTFQIMANPAPGQIKSAKVNVTLGPDNTETKITELMTAYNKLIKDYNAMTANANNGRGSDGKSGTFGSMPTTLSFVETIKRKFATGATYNIGQADDNGLPYILSLASLGLDYQLDGTLKYNSIEFMRSQANGLREKFLKGLRIGYVSATDNLMTFIRAQSSSSGALAQEMAIEKYSIDSLTKEQDNLQTRLNKIQDNYINQYSGLNALLYQLNSTSTNLGSALTALTNMSASK